MNNGNPAPRPFILRHDWSRAEVRALHDLPLTELVFRAQEQHRQHHEVDRVQLSSLVSIKTGGCVEDCGYCPQSKHHEGAVRPERMLAVDDVVDRARKARDAGASRFCMGAAWRDAKEGPAFDRVLSMVRGVRDLGMEACATLGMLNDEQARLLKEAGLTAYNHNLDTSREHYESIVSTRSYDERLETLARVMRAGIGVCCGGIIGMGESIDDRCAMLVTLASLDPHPSSVPINALVAVPNTPLADRPPVDAFELVRMIATTRIVIPASLVRLSAGRQGMSREAQMLCFLAGANSLFYGDTLLTTGNPDVESDLALLRDAGLQPMAAQSSGPAVTQSR